MLAMEIVIRTRKFAKDLSKTLYDDFEVFEAINDAMRLLAQVSAETGRAYFRKNILIQPNATLPDDFLKDSHCIDSTGKELYRVLNSTPATGEYNIVGDKFKTGAASGDFTLMYFYAPCGIHQNSDTIALPHNMIAPIAKVAAYILQSADDTALSMAQYFMGAQSAQSSK